MKIYPAPLRVKKLLSLWQEGTDREWVLIISLSILKLFLHVLSNGNYGFHRDEFLSLAMGNHLSWGYRETPPAIAAAASMVRTLLGNSPGAVRFLPAILGSGVVFFTGVITRKLKGRMFAITVAMLSVIISPGFLRDNTLFQPMVFQQFFWVVICFLLVIWIQHPERKYWIWFGVFFGMGLMNDYIMLLFGLVFFISMLASSQRKVMRTSLPWIALLIGLFLSLPHWLWQISHRFPALDYYTLLQQTQLHLFSAKNFLIEQILFLNPVTFPVWFGGLIYVFFTRQGRKYILFGWLYVFLLLFLLVLHGNSNSLLSQYPVLLALGALGMERWIRSRRRHGIKPLIIVGFLLSGVVSAPYGLPVLTVQNLELYHRFWASTVELISPEKLQTARTEKLPAYYANMFGWNTQARVVSEIYRRLTPGEKKQCVVLASNYGEAGALEYFRSGMLLPPVISYDGSFYDWGPGDVSGEILIAIGVPLQRLKPHYRRIKRAGVVQNEYAVDYETNLPVYLCRKPVKQLEAIWQEWAFKR